jgi:hypothetical protein
VFLDGHDLRNETLNEFLANGIKRTGTKKAHTPTNEQKQYPVMREPGFVKVRCNLLIIVTHTEII